MCTPTRGELLTGQDALHNGATFVCMGRSLMNPDLPTLADVFAENEYKTGHFGKWHLGDNHPHRPQDRGFQETIHHPAWGITSAADYFGNDYFDPHFRHNGLTEHFKGYCTDIWFEESMKWMQERHAAEEPFFAYVATNAPHGPLWVPDEYRQPYIDQVPYNVASFYGMIANIDENMGRLDKFLSETGLSDNTILIFMTDNGTATADKVYNAGMRGKKTTLYEGGHRVPCFIRWPNGNLGTPRDIPDTTHSSDILPTMISLCGLQQSDDADFDGVSLANRIQKEESLEDRMLVVQYGPPTGRRATGKGNAAVLWNRWRLVEGTELYNLDSDPGQEHDVAEQNPDVVTRMAEHYGQWWDRNGGNLTDYHRIDIGSDQENPARLSSCDWMNVYCDNPNGIRGCMMDSGTWNLSVAKSGTYEFSLRRWPKESDLPISSAAPPIKFVDGDLPEGKAIPAARAWIRARTEEAETAVNPDDRSVTLSLELDEGPVTMQTWWLDDQGERLAGAYYVTVEKM